MASLSFFGCNLGCNLVKKVVFLLQPSDMNLKIFLSSNNKKVLQYEGKTAIRCGATDSGFGGGEGRRTPVRKHIRAAFSGRRPFFVIPSPAGERPNLQVQ